MLGTLLKLLPCRLLWARYGQSVVERRKRIIGVPDCTHVTHKHTRTHTCIHTQTRIHTNRVGQNHIYTMYIQCFCRESTKNMVFIYGYGQPYIPTNMHTHKNTYTQSYTQTRTHRYMHIHTNTHTHRYTQTHTCTQTHTHTHVHKHTQTHKHTNTHTNNQRICTHIHTNTQLCDIWYARCKKEQGLWRTDKAEAAESKACCRCDIGGRVQTRATFWIATKGSPTGRRGC